MAIHLPDTLEVTDHDEHHDCPFCGDPAAADPDDMDRWASHLAERHGFRVLKDARREGDRPRVITLEQVGWDTRAKLHANQRVTVKDDSRPRDYAGRRGTIVGWWPESSEYAVTFDESPVVGVLSSANLDPWGPVNKPQES